VLPESGPTLTASYEISQCKKLLVGRVFNTLLQLARITLSRAVKRSHVSDLQIYRCAASRLLRAIAEPVSWWGSAQHKLGALQQRNSSWRVTASTSPPSQASSSFRATLCQRGSFCSPADSVVLVTARSFRIEGRLLKFVDGAGDNLIMFTRTR
jgi:hypothetical protein